MNALFYMFEDKNFKGKYFTLSIWLFIYYSLYFYCDKMNITENFSFNAIWLPILILILHFVLSGYSFSCLRYLLMKDYEVKLPKISFWKNFATGLKFTMATILFSAVIALILLAAVPLTPVVPFAPVISYVLVSIIGLLYLIYTPAFLCIFAKREYLSVFLRIDRAMKLVAGHVGQYITFGIFLILMGIVYGSLLALLYICMNVLESTFAVLLIAAVQALIGAYVYFAALRLLANTVNPDKID